RLYGGFGCRKISGFNIKQLKRMTKQKFKPFVFWLLYIFILLAILEIVSYCLLKKITPTPPKTLAEAPMVIADDTTIWSFKPDYHFQYTVENHIIKSSTNSEGVHDEEWTPARLGAPNRILAVGNSFTFGWGVDLNDVWWKQLADLLNKDSK